jgi:hypothetical protein
MVAILAGPSISACAPHRRSDLWRRAGAMGLGGGVPQHFWSPKEGRALGTWSACGGRHLRPVAATLHEGGLLLQPLRSCSWSGQRKPMRTSHSTRHSPAATEVICGTRSRRRRRDHCSLKRHVLRHGAGMDQQHRQIRAILPPRLSLRVRPAVGRPAQARANRLPGQR